MAFEFETPLILRLRKALGSGLSVITSCFYFLTSLLFGFYIYLFTDNLNSLPILAVILTFLSLLPFITGLAVFVGAKHREKMLSTVGANTGIIFSLISFIVLIGSYIFFMYDGNFFAPIGKMVSFFGIQDQAFVLLRSEIFFGVAALFSLLSLGYFWNMRKTILNNRPHRAFSLLISVFSIALVIVFTALAVYSFITVGIENFTPTLTNIYYIVLAVFVLISLFLTGLCGIKYYNSCGGNKYDF